MADRENDFAWVTDEMFTEAMTRLIEDRYGEDSLRLIGDHAPDAYSDIRESLNNEVLDFLIRTEPRGRLRKKISGAVDEWARAPGNTQLTLSLEDDIFGILDDILADEDARKDLAAAELLVFERLDSLVDRNVSDRQAVWWLSVASLEAFDDCPLRSYALSHGVEVSSLRDLAKRVLFHYMETITKDLLYYSLGESEEDDEE